MKNDGTWGDGLHGSDECENKSHYKPSQLVCRSQRGSISRYLRDGLTIVDIGFTRNRLQTLKLSV
jgi:hypothetical protein